MSKRKISNYKLVIQLGRDEALFALCDKGGQVLHVIALPTPEGAVEDGMIRNADAVHELIQSALTTPEFQGVHNVVFSLCTSQVITETVTTPDISKSKLEKLIIANMDMYFPVDMSEYKLVWQPIAQKKNNAGMKEQLIQLWAVPTAMLPAYYTIANACNLSVSAIDYCGMSISNAVGASFAENNKAAKASKKIDLNKEITFGRKKKAEAAEEEQAPVATAAPLSGNETAVHLTLEKSLVGLTFVQNKQVVHQRFIQAGYNPMYLIDDIAMMVEYFRSLDMGRSTDFVGFVSGALCNDVELIGELAAVLDFPLSPLDAGFDPRYVICAGAALCKTDFGIRELNKPNKELVAKTAQVGQTAALAAGGAALAGVVALTFVARFSWNATIESLEAQRQTLAIQAQKVAGYADKYKEYTTLYDNYSSDWNTVFNSLRTYNDNLVRVLDELESILPEKTSVTALAIGADGLNVQFACENKEEAAYLIMQLRELQYANLAAISSLSGGGRGAAKTYGNGEAAPKEGSAELTTEQRNELAELLISDFEVYRMTAQTSGFSTGDIYAIETNYGNLPSTDIVISEDPLTTVECKTLAQLESHMTSQGVSISADARANAMTALLNTNPFAANRLANVVYDISQKGTAAMSEFSNMSYALELYKNKDNIQDRSTPEATKASMELLTSIAIKPANQKDTESFIKKDAVLEQWYVYYLQEELFEEEADDSLVPEEELVDCEYLALDTIIADLLVEGQFSSSDAALNSKLDAYLSETTRNTVSGYVTNQPDDGGTVTPTPPVEVTPTPTPTPDNRNFLGLPMDVVDEQIEMYITEGHTDYYPLLDEQIGQYFTKGQSEYADLDEAMTEFISSGEADVHAAMLVREYLTHGKLENGVLNQLVSSGLQNGKTGNTAVDNRISALENDTAIWNTIDGLINDFINNNTTGIPMLDSMMVSYYTKGTSGSVLLDRQVDRHNLAALQVDIKNGKINAENLPVMYSTFKASGVSGGGRFYDLLFTQYKNTGNTRVNGLKQLIDPQATTTTPSGSGGGTGQPVDTRIAFTVVLGYNNELMLAELERKGLSNDSKVDKLEVNS